MPHNRGSKGSGMELYNEWKSGECRVLKTWHWMKREGVLKNGGMEKEGVPDIVKYAFFLKEKKHDRNFSPVRGEREKRHHGKK